ncbi:MAG: GNAT family N-acetyltransferase [Dehalococcoidia bacterium]
MSLTVVPFADHHLEAAAVLLASRQRADRTREPDLPARLTESERAREFLDQSWSLPMTEGAAALRDGRMVGYLLGSVVLPEPTSVMALFFAPRAAQIGDAGYAAEPDDTAHIYRQLYTAVAPAWLRAGCFTHYVTVRICDDAAHDAWLSLGFGREMVSGVHDLAPPAQQTDAGDTAIVRAGAEDVEVIAHLFRSNLRYHVRSPIFNTYFEEIEPNLRIDVEHLLADPETSPVWLAQRGVRPVGVINLVPPRPRMTTPEHAVHLQQGYTEPDVRGSGVATALLAEAFAWARGAGYGRCTINWHTANLAGARFWQRSGFRPVTLGLVRRIDDRIAWARSAETTGT